MTYEVFEQGPEVYITVFIFSLLITLAAYGAFPLIISNARKKAITKKKYIWLCYGVNFIILLVFIAIGGSVSCAPYVLWTSVFSSVGVKTLRKRGVLVEPRSRDYTPEDMPTISNGDTLEPAVDDEERYQALTDELIEEEDPTRILAKLLVFQAAEGKKSMAANADASTRNFDDPEYGLVPEKPIYVQWIDGEDAYLKSLSTVNGSPITWERRGSINTEGVSGPTDIYEIFLPNGGTYSTLYINMYGATNSTTAPRGFRYNNATKPQKSNNKHVASRQSSHTYQKIVKHNKNDSKPQNAGLVVSVVILCVLLLGSVCINVAQYVYSEQRATNLQTELIEKNNQIIERDNQISALQELVTTKRDRIFELQEERECLKSQVRTLLLELNWVFEDIVFVNDESRTYHSFGCELAEPDGIYYESEALEQGYSRCDNCTW